jgi:ribonuclease BN (tRNA processing enzyme)
MEVLFPGSVRAARRFATEVVELEVGRRTVVGGVAVTGFEVSHPCGAPPLALRIEADGKVLAYTGDTEWTESLVDCARGADLLIAESLFYDKRVKWHLDLASLEPHLPRIGAKRVILTHLGPDMLARLGDLTHEVASDGAVVEL